MAEGERYGKGDGTARLGAGWGKLEPVPIQLGSAWRELWGGLLAALQLARGVLPALLLLPGLQGSPDARP